MAQLSVKLLQLGHKCTALLPHTSNGAREMLEAGELMAMLDEKGVASRDSRYERFCILSAKAATSTISHKADDRDLSIKARGNRLSGTDSSASGAPPVTSPARLSRAPRHSPTGDNETTCLHGSQRARPLARD